MEQILTAAGIPSVEPVLTDLSTEFWTGGASGELRIFRCQNCLLFLHPPVPVCRRCHSFDIAPTAVSGRGTVDSFSVNHHTWVAGFEAPYVPALVGLEEQDDLRIITNVIGCHVDDVSIGMAVEVEFVQQNESWLPLFHPCA
jgi:uncharacterized protein